MSHRKGIALAALEDGYRVVVCAALDADVSEMERMGIEFNTVPNIRGRSIGLNDLGFIFCLWWYIRKFKPAVLHLVTPKAILYGGALARLLRVNSVVFAFSGLGSTVVGKNFREKAKRFIILYWYGLIVNYPRSFSIFQNSFLV